jgi:hypothetical protein
LENFDQYSAVKKNKKERKRRKKDSAVSSFILQFRAGNENQKQNPEIDNKQQKTEGNHIS